MSINPQACENDVLQFTEKIDLHRAKYVLSLNFNEFQSIFWKKNELKFDNDKWDLKIYHKTVKKYLRKMIENKGVLKQNYKYGKDITNGRIYVDGCGVQSLQHCLRNFLIETIYKDIDIVNCHPCILYDLCKKYKLSCPQLKSYVKNRSEIISTYGVSKLDVIIALNSDKNKNKNIWIKMLHEELAKIKIAVNEKNTGIINVTDNENNPISSIFNRILSFYENKIIQGVIKDKDYIEFVGVPMFDGFLIEKEHSIDLSNHQKGAIKFIEKSVITNINIPDFNEDGDPLSYENVKTQFEMKNFQIKNPLIYMSLVKDKYGNSDFQMYKKNEIIDLVQSYQFKNENDEDDKPTKCIFNKWLADETRRTYESFAFIPYSKNKPNINENEIYNTFKPFKSQIIDIETDDKIDTSNFYELVNELCGGVDKIAYDYLLKYIAHMFQFPEIRPEVVIILMGTTGVGKDKLITMLLKLMGYINYAYRTANQKDVFGEFTESIYNKLLLQFNEAEGKVALENHEALKNLCTEEENKINIKKKTLFHQTNLLRIFVVSNNKTPYNVQHNDRRGFIVKSTDKLQEDRIFFGKFTNDMNNKDYLNTLFTELMNIDLSKFDIKDRPKTDIFEKMRYDNITPIYYFMKDFINDKLYSKSMYVRKNKPDNEVTISSNDFFDLFTRYLNRNNLEEHLKFLKTKTVKKDLDTIKGIIADKPVKINGKTVRCHIFDVEIAMAYLKKNYFSSEKLEEVLDYGSDVEQNSNNSDSDFDEYV